MTSSLAGALVVAHLLLINSHQSLILTCEHHASISQRSVDNPRKKHKEDLVTCKVASDLETQQGAPPQLVSVYSESIQAGSISLRHSGSCALSQHNLHQSKPYRCGVLSISNRSAGMSNVNVQKLLQVQQCWLSFGHGVKGFILDTV